MKTLTIVCGMRCDLTEVSGEVLGVDRGALYCAENNIKMIVAMGDFDSVTREERLLIERYTERVIKFNPVKNDTDSEAALHFAENEGYDQAIIYGALGGRQDHNFLNLKLLSISKIPLTFIDDKHRIIYLRKGTHIISKDNYKYLSFFVNGEAKLSLRGCKYSLEEALITEKDLFTTSNEIIDETAELEIYDGELMLMQCND